MKVNKWLLLLALVALVAIAINACAPSGGGGAALNCTDKIGCVKIGPSDTIHIAYMRVVSGSDGALGQDTRNGAEIAIDDLGGSIINHKIKWDGQDSGCGAEGGQTAASKLAADTTIVAVVGSTCSSEWTAGGATICNAGFVAISPSATSPVLTDPAQRTKWPCFYRVAQNDKVQGSVAAQFVYNKLGFKNAATVHDGGPYTQGLVGAFTDAYTKLGGKVVDAEAVDPNGTDMKPVLTKIAAAKPDIIYYPIFTAAAGFITSQAKGVSGLEKVTLMTADGAFGPSFYKAAGDAAAGTYHSSPDFSAFPGGYPQFVDKYKKKFNTAPISTYHAFAYDAVMMFADAIKRAAQVGSDGTVLIGRQALRDAVSSIKDLKLITGTITCDANGDCADPHITASRSAQWADCHFLRCLRYIVF